MLIPSVVTFAGTRATLNPVSNLALNTLATATLSTSVKSAAGTQLAMPYTWSFKTEAAPTVLSMTPAAGATMVAINVYPP